MSQAIGSEVQALTAGAASLELVQGDITQSATDAIANAANGMLMAGGGVDGAIHRAAGPELQRALHRVKVGLRGGVLPTGQAVLTPGFGLKARHVIHCVGPIFAQEGARAAELLASCYRQALKICQAEKIASIAFPSISTGVYGYPVQDAALVALRTLREHLPAAPVVRVCRFVLYDDATLRAYQRAAERVWV